jgi:molecular chaperone HtpG
MGDDAEKEEARQADKENADLFDTLLENTPAAITRVIASTRLKSGNEAASCIATDGSLTIAMARFLSTRPEREGVPQPKYLLEINTRHKLFASLRTAYELQETERVKDCATVLLNQALLAEDLPIDDPLAFNAAMNALMA